MDASVILPAYVPNEELLEVTKTCIRSLKDTTERLSYELLIVDNGSYGEARQWFCHDARSYAFQDSYLRYEAPIGYARAANIGLAAAKHDWLVVINTDLEFTEKGWLEKFQQVYEKSPGGILSAETNGREGLIYDESWFSCWITHRSVIQKVGYFDESLGFRYHDQDYAIRVKRAGYEVMRTGDVQVKHIDSATYNVMGRNDDPEEAAEMRRRWGSVDFAEWLRNGQPVPV
jgi:GT2 family glycosyltransferase